MDSLMVSLVLVLVGEILETDNLFIVFSDANGKLESWRSLAKPLIVFQLVPTINGYKRLAGGEAFWAPNAVTYGYDCRGASVRIISPPSVPPVATRFEVRVPGADMNPYFALSAIFKLGLRGIAKQMKLTTPPISMFQNDPALKKEVSASRLHRVPIS
jgi:glutamine synthetase